MLAWFHSVDPSFGWFVFLRSGWQEIIIQEVGGWLAKE
jgi:hypothetical protein